MTTSIALVTGASRGIGRAIAEELAQQGHYVIGTATTEAGAKNISEYLAQIAKEKKVGEGIVLNITDPACDKVIEQLQLQHGTLSILVNNAGITQDQLALRMKDEDWDRVITTNLSAVAKLSRIVLRSMLKQKYGRIVNITSVVASIGNPGQSNYAAAKAGVEGMSRALAREVASRNITINCVAPGFIDTDMTRSLSEAQVNAIMQQIPLARLGHAKEIAAAVAFLASQQAGYITGTTLHVNGGMYMG